MLQAAFLIIATYSTYSRIQPTIKNSIEAMFVQPNAPVILTNTPQYTQSHFNECTPIEIWDRVDVFKADTNPVGIMWNDVDLTGVEMAI